MTLFVYFALLLSSIISWAPNVYADAELLVTRETVKLDLAAQSEYLSDNQLPILALQKSDALPWQDIPTPPLIVDVNTNHVWLKVEFDTDILIHRAWILNIPWAGISSIEWHLYDHNSGRWREHGVIDHWRIPPTQSPDKRPYSARLLLADKHHYTLYVGVVGGEKLIVPMFLIEEKAFIQEAVDHHLLFGLFYGILLAMLGYNLSLYIFVRDASYAFYCFYVVTILLYTLSSTGIGTAYLWRDFDWLNEHGYRFSASLAFFAAAIFIRSFLNLSTLKGWFKLTSDIAILSWGIILLLVVFFPAPWQVYLVDIFGTISCVVGFCVSVARWLQGDVSGKYMTIAWSMLILATFLLMMGLTGIIPYRVELYYFQFTGFVVEVLLLSMALAERIGRERRERITAESQSIYYEQQSLMAKSRELAAQQHALEVERQAKAELEQKVAEQTSELKLAMYALEQANHDLEYMSQVDGLTGLYNRRYFDKAFKETVERCVQDKASVAVLMLDVDFFKKVNDTYGHQAGDECLRQIASTLSLQVEKHPSSLGARYGGEEFCLVIPYMDSHQALRFAEGIRKQISQTPIAFADFHFCVSISIGIACNIPTTVCNPEKLLQAADNALYQAKDNGRDQVCIAEPSHSAKL